MTTLRANGIDLYCEINGVGDSSLVLVHGSWDSHNDWDLVVPSLSQRFPVITYDRRGHSQSERPSGQGSVTEDVADSGGPDQRTQDRTGVGNRELIWRVDLTPTCSKRPELMLGLIVHEPPLFSLLEDDPAADELLIDLKQTIDSVVERIAAGDHAGAAEHFVEIALGPGAWSEMPPEYKQIVIQNAPTFLDETKDAEQFAFDIESIKNFSKPTLFTPGDQSPPMFAPVVAKLALALPHAEVVTLQGAGHIPHVTHPTLYIDAITDFINEHQK